MCRGSRGAIEAQAVSRPSSARLASSRVKTAMWRLRLKESGDWTMGAGGSLGARSAFCAHGIGGRKGRPPPGTRGAARSRGGGAGTLVILRRLVLAEQASLARRGGGQHRRVELKPQVGRELL